MDGRNRKKEDKKRGWCRERNRDRNGRRWRREERKEGGEEIGRCDREMRGVAEERKLLEVQP